MEREDIKMLVKKWWDIYEDETLDYKNALSNLAAENERVIQALSDHQADSQPAVGHGNVPSAA